MMEECEGMSDLQYVYERDWHFMKYLESVPIMTVVLISWYFLGILSHKNYTI